MAWVVPYTDLGRFELLGAGKFLVSAINNFHLVSLCLYVNMHAYIIYIISKYAKALSMIVCIYSTCI